MLAGPRDSGFCLAGPLNKGCVQPLVPQNVVVAGAQKSTEPACLWVRKEHSINVSLAGGSLFCEDLTHDMGFGRINGS